MSTLSFPQSYFSLLTSLHDPLLEEQVGLYFNLKSCKLKSCKGKPRVVDEEAFNDLLNTNPSVITSFHFPPIESVTLSDSSDSSYDILLSSSSTPLHLPSSTLHLLLSSISINTYPSTFHQPHVHPDPFSTHAFARVIPHQVHDEHGVECIVKNSTNKGMSRAFKGDKGGVGDMIREGKEEAKRYYHTLLDTPLAHTLLSFPLAVSLHPKLSALPSFGSMLPRVVGER
eukprot:CAMPEP_0118656670 /NCGR_PEP_ID=MMETSP0785-20121206/13608_1 /TAXON_ID=91992 /ORGANISM="Bolidomonas pacifica, Strain CCMP 1866" /LENGTH=227 /DNA_ID=CAMNT_0006549535 /DNA_START=185 /DNA_END=865 /DNA_ORIENTATION=+